MTTTIDGYELKPCPFCGCQTITIGLCIYRGNQQGYFYECGNADCSCQGPVDLGKSGAAEKWNERHPIDIIVTDRERAIDDAFSKYIEREKRIYNNGEL